MELIRKLKWRLGIMMVFIVIALNAGGVSAQSQEAQQLLLNMEKLTQLKSMLSDMKKGYQVISDGYSKVKNIAEGNFSLHEVFLDGLLLVSPEVKKYSRVKDILTVQKAIVSEATGALGRFRSSEHFSSAELGYLGDVYQRLLKNSVDYLDELAMVITSSKLRMSDEERLSAIDRIFGQAQEKLMFLRDFNTENSLLVLARKKEKASIKAVQELMKGQ
jgi:hypothetical protein